MHAIGGEHEDVAGLQFALEVVGAHRQVEADRAGELAAEVGMIDGMVLGELLQLARTQQPGPGVADVGDRPGVALQRQRRQRGQSGGTIAAGAATASVVIGEPGILGADQAVKDDRRLPGGRCGMEVLHQAHHRGLRGLAPQTAGRHAIGHGRDQAATRLLRTGAHGSGEILVAFPRPAGAGVSDVDIKAHADAL